MPGNRRFLGEETGRDGRGEGKGGEGVRGGGRSGGGEDGVVGLRDDGGDAVDGGDAEGVEDEAGSA